MSWPRIKVEVLGASGKRVTEATIQHRKDTSPSHMAGD
ncbi:hypothetical protein NBRC111894_3823 [Sporolactobacillus inulinus]|uniref:Uncharacterized protein n=1 Tax=Sporolactobacillus inulinus TaxID=2078 RepID=A0A4Y1ZGX9_9BACL|nr:hypothetical protein NBRC111894_3823 [Sporolactobacillus inulinus]